MKKTKLIIAGIGGVGGYFGGLLAKHFYKSPEVEVCFVARGEHLKAIQANGLTVIKGDETFVCQPFIATDTPTDIGVVDFVVICTKSYDLEAMLQQLQPCIGQATVILPLLNGVDSSDRIKAIFPHNSVLQGCVYIISRLKKFGVVENSGNIQTLYFGLDGFAHPTLHLLEHLFKAANIEASLSSNISTIIWEKFIFLSPVATMTSGYDKCIGEILADEENLETLKRLIEEVALLAKAKQVFVPDNIAERTLGKLKALPFDTTSSMHADFKNNKKRTELSTLTGFVLAEGQAYHLPMPTYRAVYERLRRTVAI